MNLKIVIFLKNDLNLKKILKDVTSFANQWIHTIERSIT